MGEDAGVEISEEQRRSAGDRRAEMVRRVSSFYQQQVSAGNSLWHLLRQVLERSAMISKQVLVTGSAGTIGRIIVRALIARGHRVRGFDRVANPELADQRLATITDAAAVHAASLIACTCPGGQTPNATSCTNSPQCSGATPTCTAVTCNGGGNNCGTLNGHCI